MIVLWSRAMPIPHTSSLHHLSITFSDLSACLFFSSGLLFCAVACSHRTFISFSLEAFCAFDAFYLQIYILLSVFHCEFLSSFAAEAKAKQCVSPSPCAKVYNAYSCKECTILIRKRIVSTKKQRIMAFSVDYAYIPTEDCAFL